MRPDTIPGVVIGIVTDNNDPQDMGRVKVNFPWLSPDFSSDWFRMATPMAGPDRGFMFLPEVDDEVLVAFEQGDPQRGFVIGCLWNGRDRPPMTTSTAVQGGVRHRRIKTRYGHVIDLDDDGRIIIKTKNGQRLTLSDAHGGGITLYQKDNHQFYIDNVSIGSWTNRGYVVASSEQAKVVILRDEMGNAVELDAMSGTISIDAKTTVNIKASGPVNISGAMVNINSGPVAGARMAPSLDAEYHRDVEG